MKGYLEKTKDILYDFSDYIIMGGIILSIVLIIGWRLDILFPQTLAMVKEDTSVVEKTEDEAIEVIDKEDQVAPEDTKEVADVIKVSIPKGTHSTGIGSILVDNGLVESTKVFEEKVNELDLEKKLRSGEFDIAKDESLETIVKLIANQK